MEYLNKVLGIKTEIKSTIEDLPNYLTSRYVIKLVLLDDMYHLFVYPKSSIDNVKTLKTHLDEIKKELGDKKYTVQRSKGLGENEADMMSLTTMNPATRRLIKVTPSDALATSEMFDLLLGDNLEGRKNYIADYGHLYLDAADVS